MEVVEVFSHKNPDYSDGVMLCIRPNDPNRFVMKGGTSKKQIHVTLLYFGTTDVFDGPAAEQAREVLNSEIAPEFKPIHGEISTVTTFSTKDDEPAPLVLLVDAPGLAELYVKCLHSLRAALGSKHQPYANHGFTPHITLGYGTNEADLKFAESLVGEKLTFDTLELVWGTESSVWILGRQEMSISDPVEAFGLPLSLEIPSSRPGAEPLHAEEAFGMPTITFEQRLSNVEQFLLNPALIPGGKPAMKPAEAKPDAAKSVTPDHVAPSDDPTEVELCPGSGEQMTADKKCPECEMPVADMKDVPKDEPKDEEPEAAATEPEVATDVATFGAVPVHSTATTDSTDFDGDVVKTRVRSGESPAYYNQIYAWYDGNNEPDNKTAYKMPHHQVSETGDPGPAVDWAAHAALMLIEDSTIPEGDYKGVYNHLAAHLKDAGMEVPELGEDNASIDEVRAAIQTLSQMSLASAPIPVTPVPVEEEMPVFDVTKMDDNALIGEFMRRYLESVSAKNSDVAAAEEEFAPVPFPPKKKADDDEEDPKAGDAPKPGTNPFPPKAAAPAPAEAPSEDAPEEDPEKKKMIGQGTSTFEWEGVLIVEGIPSGDGRMIDTDALTWRELPLPLMLQTVNAEGHSGAVICGSIHEIDRQGQDIIGRGNFDSGVAGQEARRLLTEGTMRGVSADIDSVTVDLRDDNGNQVSMEDVLFGEANAMEVLTAGRVMGACYKNGTEILTENRGWQKFQDLAPDDRVATMDPKTHEFEWQQPTHYTADPWDGPMIRFSSGGVQNPDGDPAKFHRSLDLEVTPNHRMFVESTKTRKRMFIPAEELIARSNRSYIIPTVSDWMAPDIDRVHIENVRPMRSHAQPMDFDGDAFAAFMGAYLADGSRTDNGVFIAARATNKMRDRYAKAMRDLFRTSREEFAGFYGSHTALHDWLGQFGIAREKFVPEEVKNLSARQIRIFLDHFGDRDDRRLYTSSIRMAGDLQELAQKAGMWAVVTERPAEDAVMTNGRVIHAHGPRYVIQLRNREGSRPAKATHDWKAEWVDHYEGMVYCVTVPNEVLYVRNNGVPSWCGNTLTPFPAFQEAHISVLDKAEAVEDVVLVASGAEYVGEVWRFTSPHPVVLIGVHEPLEIKALVASAGDRPIIPLNPPMEWFAVRGDMEEPEPFTVYPDGRCYGLVAKFGSCHIGFRNRCVDVPRTMSNYRFFRNKSTLTAEGTLVATGPIFMDTVHPALKLKASDAEAHYAHTGCAVADVTLYENEWGIVASGSLRPSATDDQIRALRGSDISPDWRTIDGRLELVGLLAVNVSGFITPGLAASAGGQVAVEMLTPRAQINMVTDEVESLVAAGAVRECTHCGTMGILGSDAIAQIAEMLSVHDAKLSELSAAILPYRKERAFARIAELALGTKSANHAEEN